MKNPTQYPLNLSPASSYSSHFTSPRTLFPNLPAKNPQKCLCSYQPSKSPNSSQGQESILLKILRIIPDWADNVQERGMRQKKRTLYGPEDWVLHRSSLRHVRHFYTSISSRVVLSLVPPVLVFSSVAVIIASYNTAVIFEWLPEIFPVLRASSLPYQLTAPALALLLVFRTEASYSRFEEGKKAWTKVIAGTYDFARQVIATVHSPSDDVLKKAILQYIIAFPVALKCHLINGSNIARDLQNLLEVDDLEVVLSSKHHPRCIIDFISQSLQLLEVDISKRQILESKLTGFHEGIMVCEQLVGMPIPLAYTRLTSRILVLWHFTLPIILWDDCHWMVVPATFISAASLFCIEEVGVLIEEPFPMLPLDELCKRVNNNIEESVRSQKMIHARVKAKRKSHRYSDHSTNGRPSTNDLGPR